jgi:hypothetical protein
MAVVNGVKAPAVAQHAHPATFALENERDFITFAAPKLLDRFQTGV